MSKIREHNLRVNNSRNQKRDFKTIIKGDDIAPKAIIDTNAIITKMFMGSRLTLDTLNDAINRGDIKTIREASNLFYRKSGMYRRICEYMAAIPMYAWYVYPYLLTDAEDYVSIGDLTNKGISYIDNIFIETVFSEISLKIFKDGVYYGYMVNDSKKTKGSIIDLPIDYCRSRYSINGLPAVEFDVRYFDTCAKTVELRTAILANFPNEFAKYYKDYKDNKSGGVKSSWYLLDPRLAMKFSLFKSEFPMFMSVIPQILVLEEAKEIDLQRSIQDLLTILIQQVPLDKNGELIFSPEETAVLHGNACSMLRDAEGVDILTTFADVDVKSLESSNLSATKDPLMRVERSVFNEAGISQMLFATDGNLALEKSIANDEAIMFYLLGLYQNRLNGILDFLFNSEDKKIKISMLHLSIYNVNTKQKMFKDGANSGYPKTLNAIAMGMTQSEFVSLLRYENKVLDLNSELVPVDISSTKSSSSGDGSVGAPAKEADELSEKTIQNKESGTGEGGE